MVALGNMYYSGKYVGKNYDKAFECFSKAGNNDTSAMHIMGLMYYHGRGTKQNYQKAFEIFQKLADTGKKNSIRTLGCMYGNGKGVEQDYNKAIELLKIAMEKGHQMAFDDLCNAYRNAYLTGHCQDDIIKYFLSTGNPSDNGTKPTLSPWYLRYHYAVVNRPILIRGISSLQGSLSGVNVNTVSGVVRDKNGMTVPGASIVAKGTNIGTTTDANGNFIINMPAGSNALIVSSVGYEAQELQTNAGFTNVFLNPTVQQLSEVWY